MESDCHRFDMTVTQPTFTWPSHPFLDVAKPIYKKSNKEISMIKPATLSVNSHIENLKQQLAEVEEGSLDYVIISHSDNRMINQLKEAFIESSIAVVSIPQNCWMMNDEPIAELMDAVVNDLNIGGILLVGHSQGGIPEDNIQVCTSGQVDKVQSGSTNRITSLLDRVKHVQSCMKENEKHFLQQLECLKLTPAVQTSSLRSKNLVQGLFYRAESGVFCMYDSENQTFRALIEEVSFA